MKRAIVGSLVLSFATGVVWAQETSPPSPGPASQGSSASAEFRSIDANRDGRLSTAEVQAHSDLKSSFASLDEDRDSYLSQSEYSKWNKAGKMTPGTDASQPADVPRSDVPTTDPVD